AIDSRVGELCARAGPIAALVENSRHGFFAAILDEQLVDKLPDRHFLGIGLEFLVFPAVAKRRSPSEWLTEFRPDRNSCLYALGYLFAFPLGHRRNNREKQPAGRRAGIDGLVKTDHVRIRIAEFV